MTRLPLTPFDPLTNSNLPRYRQVFVWLQQAILAAELKSGEQLPATRDLAHQLNLSRNTVKSAFELLQAEAILKRARVLAVLLLICQPICCVTRLQLTQTSVYNPSP
ncbi:hypothetical protein LH51_00580 [Nitrincola sp. A-D6]|uniref:GntR family transcriptional regulator n=1 Tax=Nitrincola sp. A-D6 TaxID=1545442 RepID=UPI00051FD42C|nr:winged helix-turn-helix domain-containing protein [Nitrincola sp. A-D6]KGK43343.1 hypothetical protein LH51_00580 [Nitrincola sp. A-D6]